MFLKLQATNFLHIQEHVFQLMFKLINCSPTALVQMALEGCSDGAAIGLKFLVGSVDP